MSNDNPLRTDCAIDRLKLIADCVERMNAQEIDPLEALEGIASALYGDTVEIVTRDDAIDLAHTNPELNRVADMRTTLDAMIPDTLGRFGPIESEAITHAIELCDAYIGLRAQCPPGSLSVVPGDEFTGQDDDGNPTTFFDAIVGALEFAEVHTLVSEVK
jgi:hypothetical protein